MMSCSKNLKTKDKKIAEANARELDDDIRNRDQLIMLDKKQLNSFTGYVWQGEYKL